MNFQDIMHAVNRNEKLLKEIRLQLVQLKKMIELQETEEQIAQIKKLIDTI